MLRINMLGSTALSSVINFAPREPGGGGDGGDSGESMDTTVFDNLGLDASDFGDDAGDDLGDDGDQGGDDDLGDDGDVSHTPQQRQQRQQQRQSQQRPQPRMPVTAEVKPDARGNLVDRAGKVVARAGKEARLYQDAHNARTQVTQLSARVTDTQTKLARAVEIGRGFHQQIQQFEANNEALKQFNITPEKQLEAYRLFNDLQSKPLETLKVLLTRAAAGGIDITSLNAGGASLDVKGLLDGIKQELTPIKQQFTADQERARIERETRETSERAAREVTTFFERNQEAIPYASVFQKVLATEDGKNMTFDHIWANIKLNLLQHPENRQRFEGDGQQRQRRNPGMVNGRQRPQGRVQVDEVADTRTSYDDIIKDVLAA